MRLKRSWALFPLAAMLTAVTGIQAQVTNGSLRGFVKDASGGVIPQASVTLTNQATGSRLTVSSNESGLYVFPSVPASTFALKVEFRGFKTYEQKGIVVRVGEHLTNDVSLQIGEVGQIVEVESTAQLVGTSSAEVQTVVDSQRMQELPLNGRNVLSLINLAPTTTDSVSWGGAAINGQRGEVNVYQLDGGVFQSKDYQNRPNTYPPPEAVREFALQTSAFKAENGSGANLINAITRSGTNEYHGTLWEYLRNDKLDARSFFASSKSPFKRNQFGFDFGGPIKKNKLFAYGFWQGERVRGGAGSRTATVPTAAERSGDLSGFPRAIKDPATGENFPGNKIPAALIHPVAKSLLANHKLWPLPNHATNPQLLVTPVPGGNINGPVHDAHRLLHKRKTYGLRSTSADVWPPWNKCRLVFTSKPCYYSTSW